MNPPANDQKIRKLKLATQKLLKKFDSLEKAAALCRVKPSNLSQYQNFDHSTFMPADVVLALETACGKSIVSQEMVKLLETHAPDFSDRGVIDEAMDIPVAVGELLAFLQEATHPDSPAGKIMTETEKRRYFGIRQHVAKELEQLDIAVERDGVLRFPN